MAGAGEAVEDGIEPLTGAPIYSLYGTQKKPTSEMLKDLDILVFDMQDIGIRYYTYLSTLTNILEAASKYGIPVLILDRINPLGREVEGSILEEKFKSFLKWCSSDLWKPKLETEEFEETCSNFYFDKTIERIAKLEKATGIEDKEEVINNTYCRPVKEILVNLDKYRLTEGVPCKFHGDCVPDNIIEKDGKFTLIDWRQEFGGGEVGDVYYDLAKLNHGLTFDIASSNHYKVDFNKEGIEVDIFRSDKLARCREVLYDFLREYDYDIKKVEILTSLIWINMAPLHEGDLKTFLFYFGKFYLNKYYVS